MDPEITDASETPAAEPQVEKTFDERLLESIEGQLQQDGDDAAAESVTDDAAKETETVEEPAAAETETPAVVEPKTTTTTEPPFTEEQLQDEAFFDKLDKDGWAKLQTYNPALYKMGKQVASLRGKAGAALKNVPAVPSEERSEAEPPKVSEAMKVALRKAQSLDEDEALEGAAEVARLTLREERAREQETQQKVKQEAKEVFDAAFDMAAAELPEIANISDAELDKVVESSPKLMQKLRAALSHPEKEQRVLLVADVMESAGRVVIAARQAADRTKADAEAEAKKADVQKRLRSNESNPAKHLVETPGGKQLPRTGKSFEADGLAFVQSQLAKTSN